jgi:hypothetical protein
MGAGAVAFLSAGKKIERRTRQDFLVDALPLKRYPMEEVIQTELENLTPTVSELRAKRPGTSLTRTSSMNWKAKSFLPG